MILLLAAAVSLGWVPEGSSPSFLVREGVITVDGKGNVPTWLRSDREFEDVRLRFEYRLAQWSEAGVILRAPRTARPQRAGVGIVLAHDYHRESPLYATGALLGVSGPRKMPPPSFGVWRRAEIELRGARLRVSIDGEPVQDTVVPDHTLRRGYLGFPDMGYAYSVRNIEAEDLGSSTKLIHLREIDTWQKRDTGGTWREAGDVITGADGSSILYAPPVFSDFELSAVVRSHNRVNGGIFLRGQPKGPNRGFEVQIFSSVDSIYPTGSIYGIQRSAISADFEERWFLMQIRVEGQRCRVWLDGELAAETANLPDNVRAPGRIGLQIHKENASVEFRDLRIRPLP